MTHLHGSSLRIDDYTPTDSFFGAPYIDLDEWRTVPVEHRYVHGGFSDTDARFSFYFPPEDRYEGRMVMTFGGALGGDEHSVAIIDAVLNAFHNAFDNGAYLIESNQGHLGPSMEGLHGDLTIMNGRTDTETARLSKHVAEQIYGRAPLHNYCFGGSGGGNFTLRCMEIEGSIFDGGVPFMFGGSSFSDTMNAVRLLRPRVSDVLDATAAGGSGDPFATLDTDQREALASLYRSGFQRGSEFQLVLPMPEISWPTCMDMTNYRGSDPGYFSDFWNQPGYLGGDGRLDSAMFEMSAVVDRVLTTDEVALASPDGFVPRMLQMLPAGTPLGIVLRDTDPANFTCSTLTVRSGKAAGRRMYNFLVLGEVLIPAGLGSFFDPLLVEGLAAGDEIMIDNRDFLAYCYLSRHRVFHPLSHMQYEVMGKPVYPMRSGGPAGSMAVPFTSRFKGKMILLQHLLDRPCWPPAAVQYHRDALTNFGSTVDQHFRLWWTENAMHGPARPEFGSVTDAIDYGGLISQALRDVIAWVEDGTDPAPTYSYDFVDGQVVLDGNVARRGGIQPAVQASANGAARADVVVGEPVHFAVEAAIPPGGGYIVGAEWDVDGSGTWTVPVDGIDGRSPNLRAAVDHTFVVPGTYFPTVRVHAHRSGDTESLTERLDNIAKVRVVVSAPS
jgi:hypothetical protein